MVAPAAANPPRRPCQDASTPRRPEPLAHFAIPTAPATRRRQERDEVRGDRQVRVQPSRVPTYDERLNAALLAYLVFSHLPFSRGSNNFVDKVLELIYGGVLIWVRKSHQWHHGKWSAGQKGRRFGSN
ncbi:hypothetical protein ACP70R_025742 [Stipagrostis hirtigluma subsp. patula]